MAEHNKTCVFTVGRKTENFGIQTTKDYQMVSVMEGKEQRPPIKLKTYSKKQEVIDISLDISERFDVFIDTSEENVNLGNSLTENADGNLSNLGISLQDSFHQYQVLPEKKEQVGHPITEDTVLTEPKSVSDGNCSNLGISLQDDSFEDLPDTDGYILTSTPQKINSVYDIENDSFLEDVSPVKNTQQCHEFSINETKEDSVVFSQYEKSSESEKETSFYDLESVQLVKSNNSRKRRAITAIQRPSKLLWKNTERSSIAKCKYTKCCDSLCLAHFTLKSIGTLRFKYWTKTRSERRQWLLEKVTGSCKNTRRKFVLDGQNICSKAFMKIYNTSKNLFYDLQQEGRRGVVVTSPKQGRREHGERYIVAMNWLEDYATYRGDRMPDSDKILLPYRTRRNRVYNLYKEEHSLPIHISTFSDMWNEFFPHLKIKKTNSFSRCTTCTSIERQIEKTLDIKKREKLLKLREEHNALQMGERKHYYRKREAARTRPDKFLSIIIDGMDQSKTNLPHFVGRIAKAVNPSDQLKTHITGIMAHGQNKFSTYLDMQEFPHDSNLTMNLLLKMMHKLSKEMRNRLPPVCYLQCDNCWRENKNRYMLGLCELFIHKRIFNEVHLSFLMVGHTHEDIDAAFSKIADTLRRTDAETLPQLLDLLTEVEEVKHLFNIRDWMAPYLNSIQKHTRPHHYKFQWDFQQQLVSSFYKGKESDAWKSMDCILKQIPTGKPGSVAPNFENLQIQRIESHLHHWQCLFTDQIGHSEVKWWKSFIASVKAKPQTPRPGPIRWTLPLLPQQPNTVQDDDIEIPEGIQKLIAKDKEQPEVRVVQRK